MQEVSELKFRINLLLAMASVSDAEIARQAAKIQELERTLEAVRSSTSWRVTAFLRWLGRIRR
jgi:hypothetical protein